MNRKDYSFGLLLVFVGALFLLLNLKVLTFEWLMFILSIGLIIGYFIKSYRIFDIWLGILGISLVSLFKSVCFSWSKIRFLFPMDIWYHIFKYCMETA